MRKEYLGLGRNILILSLSFAASSHSQTTASQTAIDPKFSYAPTPEAVAFEAMMKATTKPAVSNWEASNLPGSTKLISLFQKGARLFALSDKGLMRSDNDGVVWSKIGTGPASSLNFVFSPTADGGNIYVASDSGIAVSNDNGASWKRSNAGMHAHVHAYSLVQLGRTLFAGTDSGVYASIDNGINWTASNRGLPLKAQNGAENPNMVSAMISTNNILLAAVGGKMYRSQDYGSSWGSVDTGLNYINDIRTLAVVGAKIFAASTGNGVYASNNNGNSWAWTGPEANSDNGERYSSQYEPVKSLVVFGPNLFAITSNGSVSISTNNGLNWGCIMGGLPAQSRVASLAATSSYLYAWLEDGNVYRIKNLNN
jgi:photosystem II stability/assembly factor-like uncharacterized protein